MMNIKVNILTWYFLFISFICGYLNISLIIFFIVIIHELGHVTILKLLGYKINSINIYPFGGIINLSKDLNTPLLKEFIIASAGIFFQLILFLIMPYLLTNLHYHLFLKYNLAIILFNLIPIIPLDGAVFLNLFFNKFFSYKKSLLISNLFSFVFIFIYILFNYWYSLNNYLIISLFIYKTIEKIKNSPYLYNKFLLERYLNNYNFKYLSTKKGNLDILKIDTYQYFKENNKLISEKEKLQRRFDKP